MSNDQPQSRAPLFLINRLTVDDARKLVRHEGGELGTRAALMQVGMALITAALTARAIVVGDATVWHLLLPLLARYVTLLLVLPVLQAYYRLEGLRPEIRKCYWNVAVIVAISAGVLCVRAALEGRSFPHQFRHDGTTVIRWIVDHQMQWPILSASLGFAMTLPARFRNYRDIGPPFVSVSFGCAMQLVVLIFGGFLAPVIVANPSLAVWVVWALLLTAELGAAFALWEIQRRLRALDSSHRE